MEREIYLKEVEKRKAEGQDADGDDARGLRNQFNFSERASQTLNAGVRERGTITEPPASVEFAAIATQWEIYDGYMEDQERQRQAREKSSKAKKGADDDKAEGAASGGAAEPDDVVHSEPVAHAAKILERMVNQNAFDDISQDYKYWEDASDQYREGEGTLLPLWKFQSDKAKRKHVTSIKWNPAYACPPPRASRTAHARSARAAPSSSAPAPPCAAPGPRAGTTTCLRSGTARTTS